MSKTNCSVYGCSNTYAKTASEGRIVQFYSFPAYPWQKEQREAWINFTKRKNLDGSAWFPTRNSYICSDHFIDGQRSKDPRSPSFNPSIYPGHSVDNLQKSSRYKRLLSRSSFSEIKKHRIGEHEDEKEMEPESPLDSTSLSPREKKEEEGFDVCSHLLALHDNIVMANGDAGPEEDPAATVESAELLKGTRKLRARKANTDEDDHQFEEYDDVDADNDDEFVPQEGNSIRNRKRFRKSQWKSTNPSSKKNDKPSGKLPQDDSWLVTKIGTKFTLEDIHQSLITGAMKRFYPQLLPKGMNKLVMALQKPPEQRRDEYALALATNISVKSKLSLDNEFNALLEDDLDFPYDWRSYYNDLEKDEAQKYPGRKALLQKMVDKYGREWAERLFERNNVTHVHMATNGKVEVKEVGKPIKEVPLVIPATVTRSKEAGTSSQGPATTNSLETPRVGATIASVILECKLRELALLRKEMTTAKVSLRTYKDLVSNQEIHIRNLLEKERNCEADIRSLKSLLVQDESAGYSVQSSIRPDCSENSHAGDANPDECTSHEGPPLNVAEYPVKAEPADPDFMSIKLEEGDYDSDPLATGNDLWASEPGTAEGQDLS